jgi:arginine decarboxylase
VYNIIDVCDAEGVAHPTIVSESGRAIVAHHSILVVEAFSAIEKEAGFRNPDGSIVNITAGGEDDKLLHEILDTQRTLTRQNRMEALHDAQGDKEQAQSKFDLGLLDLETKAKIETVYWQIARQVVEFCKGMKYVPDEVKDLEVSLGDQYVCNFSVFQSLLDHWALGQLFPVMPVHHLETFPDRQGTLVDITCDSDGKVNKFIDLQDVRDTLPLHRLTPGGPYLLGFFLMGAYQDIMGDLHNLFGRVNEAHVFLDDDEECGWYIEETIGGSTIADVLRMTQWDQTDLAKAIKSQCDEAIKSDRLKPSDAMKLLGNYERALQGYTYLQIGRTAAPGRSSRIV